MNKSVYEFSMKAFWVRGNDTMGPPIHPTYPFEISTSKLPYCLTYQIKGIDA